ncbi:ABC transporter permease [Megasphaera paucivorans]|uniref:Peptide/nickel transport system permease protein n=1 Tax=Megasphaera paucivorans TaxID=349095 RepID=A0A1G9SZX6_9FIRM|nr:ABC transporter permease [Megasphaera paucivorans]SDM40395.1 peptide/nickel transport system permease protein [Megasphaera paucivorans]
MDAEKLVLVHQNGMLGQFNPEFIQEEKEAQKKTAEKVESWGKITWRRFCKNRVAYWSMFLFFAIILLAVLAPVISPYDPVQTVGAFDEAPSIAHLLGTDDVGRDVLSRLIYGSQVSLIVGIGSVVIYAAIGITLGLLSGYFGGVIDGIIMRITEVFMAYPQFMIILVIVSLIGPNMITVMLVMGLMGWPPICRLVRGEVLRVKSMDYVSAAIVTGYSPGTIVFKHILPNVLSPILVNCTFGIASAILIEASLSFLGMGVQPPAASWGNMLTSAQSITILSEEPWRWIPPGIAILIAVLTINFLGDGLNEAIDGDSK